MLLLVFVISLNTLRHFYCRCTTIRWYNRTISKPTYSRSLSNSSTSDGITGNCAHPVWANCWRQWGHVPSSSSQRSTQVLQPKTILQHGEMASGSVVVMLQIRHLKTCLVSSSNLVFSALTNSISFSLSFRIQLNCSLSFKSASTLASLYSNEANRAEHGACTLWFWRALNRAIRWWWRCCVYITGLKKLWRRFKIIITVRNNCNSPAWDLSLPFFWIFFVICQCNCSDSFLAFPEFCTYMDVQG